MTTPIGASGENANRELVLVRRDTEAIPRGPVVLAVLDGVGVGTGDTYDAVHTARTPTLDRLSRTGLYRAIYAHGTHVGLPSDRDMGNSEVGHNILGAGRIIDQGATKIDKSFESGAIWSLTWPAIVEQCAKKGGALHLIGLLSDGNVHSNTDHLYKILAHAKQDHIRRVFVHVLLDGRDVPDRTAHRYVQELEDFLAKINQESDYSYRIASGGGRMTTTMDRYGADWRIVENGWRAHALGQARGFSSALAAIETFRSDTPGISDQLLPPFVVDTDGTPVGPVQDGDAVICFNFRGDRAIEISRAFTEGDEFTYFDRVLTPDVLYAGMTLYDGDTNIPSVRLTEPEVVPETISEYLSAMGIRQWAGAETQKFGHVTYFWNGNRSEEFNQALEKYVDIPSDQVPANQRPWMKSAETADQVLSAIESGEFDFIRVNFAGGDMVGHTGDFEATVIAVEAIDLALSRIANQLSKARGCLVITGDHGNAEAMVERSVDGQPLLDDAGNPVWKTSHSLNPVPLIIKEYGGRNFTLRDNQIDAGLANIAATLIDLLGYIPPKQYADTLVEFDQD